MYTDYFDQPLAEGDEIIYPMNSGSHRNCFLRTKILKVVPLVQHRDHKRYLMREDQAHQQRPTQYPNVQNPAKAFVLIVYKPARWGNHDHTKFTIRYCENVVKVPV